MSPAFETNDSSMEVDDAQPPLSLGDGEIANDRRSDGEKAASEAKTADDAVAAVVAAEPVATAENSVRMGKIGDADLDDHPDEEDFFDESEQRRRAALEHMILVEREFNELKEQLFNQKFAALRKEMDLISQGIHPDFIKEEEKLKQKRNEKRDIAKTWKSLQERSINLAFDCEMEQCEVDLKSGRDHYRLKESKHQLREKLIAEVHAKRRRITDELERKVSLGHRHESADVPLTRAAATAAIHRRNKEAWKSITQSASDASKRSALPKPGDLVTPLTSLSENDVNEDLATIHGAKQLLLNYDLKEPDFAFADSDSLYINGRRYRCRNHVHVIEFNPPADYVGAIISINKGEVWIRKTDQSKTRLFISQINRGHYTIVD